MIIMSILLTYNSSDNVDNSDKDDIRYKTIITMI